MRLWYTILKTFQYPNISSEVITRSAEGFKYHLLYFAKYGDPRAREEKINMDFQQRSQLIRQDMSGTYCVGFLNSHALDIEEIRTIFSAFGEVINIKETGDKTGYRFVRYDYADEAEKAVEGLKNHSKIRLVEHRPKTNQQKAKKSENQKNENRFQNGSLNKKNNNKNFNSNQNRNENFEKENLNHNGNFQDEIQNKNGNIEFDQHSKEIHEEENQNSKKFCKENQVQKNEKYKSNNTKEISNNTNLLNNAKSRNSLNSISDSNVLNPNSNSSTSSLSNGSLYVEDDYIDDIPDLVASKKQKVENINILNKNILSAEEIIVGNIPNEFGSPFILHLFECYNPLAISDIIYVKNSGLRYCHVYFKTIQDSLAVENKFDKMVLSNQKILVRRPSQLIQDTLC